MNEASGARSAIAVTNAFGMRAPKIPFSKNPANGNIGINHNGNKSFIVSSSRSGRRPEWNACGKSQ